jgi:hypothetical protein
MENKKTREEKDNESNIKNEFLIILSAHLTSYAFPSNPLTHVLIFSFQFPLQSYSDNNCYAKFKYIIFNYIFLFSYQNNLSSNFIEDQLIHRTDIRRVVNTHRLVNLSEDYRCRFSTDIVS